MPSSWTAENRIPRFPLTEIVNLAYHLWLSMVNLRAPNLLVSVLVRITLAFVVLIAIVFATAGRWDLPMFWAYLGVFYGIGLIGLLVVARRAPTLLRERYGPGPGGKDRLTRKAALVLSGAFLVLAGLDAGRFQWSGSVPISVQIAGLVGVAAGLGGWMWAMCVNRFFSSEVRIQRDRGHTVVTTGPYQFVRHPGYLSALVLFLASPLALGSCVSALPILVLVGVFLRRVWIEDQLLREELEGYLDYAQRVRYRLVPGVW